MRKKKNLLQGLLACCGAVGLTMAYSVGADLLDAYEDSMEYREHVDPIVESIISTGQAPQLGPDGSTELSFAQMGAPDARYLLGSLKLRFWVGVVLAVGGLYGALALTEKESKRRIAELERELAEARPEPEMSFEERFSGSPARPGA